MRPILAALVALAALPAPAGVVVSLDAPTLDRLLNAVVAKETRVVLMPERAVRVLIEDLRVLGFDPDTTERRGAVRTALKVRVPELGIDLGLRPRVRLDVARSGEQSVLELNFEGLEIPLPFGRVDLARMLPPLRYPTDQVFGLDGGNGEVAVRSRLSRITLDRQQVRFELDLEVQP